MRTASFNIMNFFEKDIFDNSFSNKDDCICKMFEQTICLLKLKSISIIDYYKANSDNLKK
jgi:hypothetical protein